MHITDDFLHVRVIFVGIIGFVFVQNLDDALARFVADRFLGFVVAICAFPADFFGVLGLQKFFEFRSRHIDGFAKSFESFVLF